VVVDDLSPVQLLLNEEKVREAGYEQAVGAREVMDVVKLSWIAEATFDAAVCFGDLTSPLPLLGGGFSQDMVVRGRHPGQ
jgi:uroporphyrinogen-III decarboxylase